MIIAVPNYEGRVSPVFDAAARLTLVRTGQPRTESKDVLLMDTDPFRLARTVAGLGVEVLICGAISHVLHNALLDSGVRVIPEVCGSIDLVTSAFEQGQLDRSEFRTPGCNGRKTGSPHSQESDSQKQTDKI